MYSINDEQKMQAGLNGIIPNLISKQSNDKLFSEIPARIPKISNTDYGKSTLSDISLEGAKAGKDNYKNQNKFNHAIASATSKVNNSGFGSFMNNNTGLAGAISVGLKTAGELIHKNRTGLQKTDEGALKIRDAQYSVLKKIPITAPFAAAAEVLDNTLGAITGGLGSATKADKVLTALPLLGNTAAIFAGKTDTFKGDIQEIDTGDFGGVVSDSLRAQDLSGVKSVQAKKLNKQIRSAQADFNKADDLIDYNTFRKNHNIGQELQSAILNKYQGNQQIMLSKKGAKLGLDQARKLLQESKKSNNNLPAGIALNIPGNGINKAVADTINIVDKAKGGLTEKEIKDILFELTASATGNDEYKFKELVDNNKEYFVDLFNKSGYENYVELIENNDYENIYKVVQQIFNVQSFKSGGKIEKENIIPTGALHKNLHHIEEANPELEGKITKKGIPVGTYDDNGEFQQTCEVESGELIIDLKHTKYIEDLHDEYKRTEDDNIAIDCGKFIVSQIFSNTKDDDKVIKKTE